MANQIIWSTWFEPFKHWVFWSILCVWSLQQLINLPKFLLCSDDIEQLVKRKHVYHVTDEEGKSLVVACRQLPSRHNLLQAHNIHDMQKCFLP